MQYSNTHQQYDIMSTSLHWLTASAIYGMFILGVWMVSLTYYDDWYHRAPELHKSIGFLLMVGLVIRLIWRLIPPPPPFLKSYSRLTKLSASLGRIALYVVAPAIGVSGYLISTAGSKPISIFGWFYVSAIFDGGSSQADLAGSLHLWFDRLVRHRECVMRLVINRKAGFRLELHFMHLRMRLFQRVIKHFVSLD